MFTNLLINFYSNVYNFIFLLIFISIHTPSWQFFFRLIGRRANKSGGQVQRSHSVPLVLKFYILILIYFNRLLWKSFWIYFLVLVFVTFLYFFYFVNFVCGEMLPSRLCKSLLFLTHSSWAFSWVFCIRFAVI